MLKGFPYLRQQRRLGLVGELTPGHHDEEIADADDAEIRDPFIINEATFVDIIAAASAQTRPMFMKTTAVE